MRAAFWIAAATLILPTAQALALDATAASPSQTGGATRASGLSWALLVFSPDASATINIDLPALDGLTNHSAVWTRMFTPLVGGGTQRDAASADRPWSGPLRAEMTFGAGRWSSLLVVGSGINVGFSGNGELQTADDETPPFNPGADIMRGAYRPFDAPGDSVLVRGTAASPDGAVPFDFRADRIQRVEWHNVTVACPSGLACPDGAGTFETRTPAFVAAVLAYLEAKTGNGTGAGGGTVHAIAAGASSFDLAMDGNLRLPEAVIAACTAVRCPAIDGTTLTLQGGHTEARIEPASDKRLRFAVTSFSGAAFSDEGFLPTLSRAAPAIAAIAVGLLLVKLAFVLAARLRADPLANKRRRKLYEVILANPGASFRELMRRTHIANGSLLHHLGVLGKSGLVVDQAENGRRLFFENHGRYDETWQMVTLLRDEPSRVLFEWVASHPHATQGEILAVTSQNGLSRSPVQKRLRRLVANGLLEVRRDGRSVRYAAVRTEAKS